MRTWLIALAVVLLSSTAFAQEAKLGYVDLQRALNESQAGAKAKEEFKREVDRLQLKLKKQKEDLETLKAQLEKKALVMKEDEQANLQKDYQRRLRDFERTYKDSQSDLQDKDNQLTAGILQELHGVIRGFGRREGYTLIFERSASALLYGSPTIDLTDRIIQLYDAKKKEK